MIDGSESSPSFFYDKLQTQSDANVCFVEFSAEISARQFKEKNSLKVECFESITRRLDFNWLLGLAWKRNQNIR